MGFDYTSPVSLARIHIIETNETITLNARPRQVSGKKQQVPNLSDDTIIGESPIVTATSVRLAINGLPEAVTIRMEASFERGIEIMESRLLDLHNKISVKFGYSKEGVWTPWYYGIMVKPAKVNLDPETGFLAELSGNISLNMIKTVSVRRWEGKTREEVVRDLAARNGMVVAYTPSKLQLDVRQSVNPLFRQETSVVASPTDASRAMTTPKDWEQGGRTEWTFLTDILKDAGAHWYIGTDGAGVACLFIKDAAAVVADEPTRTFVMRRKWDHEKGVFPLLSFSCDTPLVWLSGISRNIHAADVDMDTKKIAKVALSQLTSNAVGRVRTLIGGQVETDGFTDPESGLVIGRGTTSSDSTGDIGAIMTRPMDEELDWTASLQAVSDSARPTGGLTAVIKTFGLPNILPLETYTLLGISRRFEGNWFVTGVDHTFSGGVWMTSMTVMSEGMNTEPGNFVAEGATQRQVAAAMATEHQDGGDPPLPKGD